MTNLKEPEEEVNVIKNNTSDPIPITESKSSTEQTSVTKLNTMNNPLTIDNSSTNLNKSFSLGDGFSSLNNNVKENINSLVKPLEIIKEDKIQDKIQEPKSPRKEMVAVKDEGDIDETSSLANFFDDVKKIVEDKGIKIETNNDKMFTLFEDANEVEK